MSAWPGKFAIGLTGNIATGKSVVRKMLEHLGAYGIDADALAHRTFAPGAPGYEPVVELFGKWILAEDGQIDRARLGKVVFTDPEALDRLEAVVHPLVGQAVDILVRRSKQPVVVIEAIKLLESELGSHCDSLWVTYAPVEVQLARLRSKRGMKEEAARQRILAQPSQEKKIAAANVVIRNYTTFDDTWRQVYTAWETLFPGLEAAPEPVREGGKLVVRRARPRQAAEIAAFLNAMGDGSRRLKREDIMAAFGEKAFLLLLQDEKLLGLVGWEVENLVARTDEITISPELPFEGALRLLMDEVERASKELQCEASLLFLPPALARQESVWRALGYEPRTVESLNVSAWQEAAVESMPAGAVMLFKQLRKDRVLRPV
jgi:dephospho-CoA kinase